MSSAIQRKNFVIIIIVGLVSGLFLGQYTGSGGWSQQRRWTRWLHNDRPPPSTSTVTSYSHKQSIPMAAALKFLTVPAVTKQTATVFFVHGLGDTGHGWKPVAEIFKADPALAHIKWVLPHAPVQTVTANMGLEMPSWFDILSFGFDGAEDKEGMLKSSKLINDLIDSEIKSGIDPSRIILGGFSQGGAMSLLTGLTGPNKLAALIVLSGWLPLRQEFKAMATHNALATPIFWGHGKIDPLVKYNLATLSSEFLTKDLGVPLAKEGETIGLSFNTYEGVEHSTNMKELEDVKAFIKKVLPA